MTLPENRIYLASRSPRRRDLLKQIGVNFGTLLLREAVPRAEIGRARLAERRLPDLPVLAADTIVVLKGRIFGKPENSEHAKEMLRALSGQTHHVFTAVAMSAQNGMRVCLSRSSVRFRNISEQEICSYLAYGESQDKAGAYAIQGTAAVFIAEISGSYSGVMGLPLFETAQLLEESGIKIFHRPCNNS